MSIGKKGFPQQSIPYEKDKKLKVTASFYVNACV